MKITNFNLLAVGPFTDVSLDLSAGEHGLHVILGPNEAGKSSALRALRALFYGFPPKTGDTFVHENTRLRVGATLRHSDGTELTVVRRKGNRDTLLNADGTPLDDGALARFIGTVDLQQFTTFFGLGHHDLRAGGEEILKGGAKVGESLFAAGAGGLRLRKLLENIEARADELYKPRSRNPKIAMTLAAHREAIKTIGELSLSVDEWSKHDAELLKAKEEVADIQRQIDGKTATRYRLERLRRAIPLLACRRAAREAIAVIGEVPALPADFSENRRNAARSLHDAETAAADLKQKISRLDEEIGQLNIPQELLEQGESVETLYAQLRSYQEAIQQAPILRVRRDESRLDAQRILRGLRPDVSIEQVEELRLSTARREQLQVLSRESEALKQSLKLARKLLADIEEEKRQYEVELAELPQPCDAAPLQSVLAVVQKRGPLEKQLADGLSSWKRQSRAAEADLKKLGLWSGTLAELEVLSAPSIESIENARTRQDKLQAERDRCAEEVRRLETELAEIDHQLEVVRAAGEIPSESDLQKAREHREHGWALVRQAWLAGGAPPNAVAQFTGDGQLAGAYERSVNRADDFADALRAEADRVARQAALVPRRKLTEDKLRRERLRLAEVNDAMEAALADWKSAWKEIGIAPLSPREMSGWASRQRDLAQIARKVREDRDTLAELEKEITGHRDSIVGALGQMNVPVAGDASLSAALAQTENVVEQIRSETADRAKLQAAIKKLDAKRDKAREGLSSAEHELAAWAKRWQEGIEGLGVPTGAEPAVAMAVVRQIDDLFLKIESARAADNDIAQRQARIEAFERQARDLISRLAPDYAPLPIDQASASLYARLKKAREDATRRDGLTARRRQAADDLDKSQRKQLAARESQAALLRIAGCESIEQIPGVEERHLAWVRSTAELEQANRELLLLAAGESIDELTEQAKAIDADALPAQLSDLSDELERLHAARTEHDQKIGQERTLLSQMDGNARAAEAAEQAQELLADLRQSTEDYARLKLAGKILHRGIERYRQRKQGPLLGRASAIFSRLTLGSFDGLQADYDESDQPVLVGVRGSSKHLEVSAMSDGTRDQLFLALRLATLEDFLSRNEPIPFVLDDILINFDNDRADATLKILADLSKKTQVILFTHHAHIAEMAGRMNEDVYQTMLVPGSVAVVG